MRRGISTAGKRTRGFTYLAVLAAVVVMGISAQIAVTVGSTEAMRAKEAELLFRGMAYQDAIRRYYLAAQPPRYPRSLDDLLKDPRFLHKRHLRRLYPDPMGGEWRLIVNRQGGITGVASASDLVPLKSADFPRGLDHFAGTGRYRDWIFSYQP